MAYGLRYTIDWHSPMRDKRHYTLYIYKEGYSGESEELPVTGEVMSLTAGERDADELTPILSSELSISLMCLRSGDPYTELYTLDPLGYKVMLGECRPNSAGAEQCIVMWQGYLANGDYRQPYANAPYRVELRANDGLAALKSIAYADADGNRYTDTLSIGDIIQRILDHIDGSVALWPYTPIKPSQADNTLDLIGLSSAAIYATDGDKTPSCYDVLERVLRTFGLQMFQSYGRWHVRSVYSLVDYSRPTDYHSVAQGFGVGERDTMLPLNDPRKEGRGLLSTATLSMLRPLGTLSLSHPESKYSSPISEMRIASRWRNAFMRVSDAKKRYTAESADETVRMTLSAPTDTPYFGQAFVLEELYSSAAKVDIAVSFDVWNRANEATTINVGLIAIDSSIDPTSWTLRKDSDYQVTIVGKIAMWNPSQKTWGVIPTGNYPTSQIVSLSTSAVAIEASDKSFTFAQNVSTRLLKSASATINAIGLPDLGIDSFRLMVVVVKSGAGTAEINIGNPHIEIAQTTTVVSDNLDKEMTISRDGIEDAAYVQAYCDSWVLPVTDSQRVPALVEVSNVKPVQGFVSPTLRGRLLDIVAEQVKELRGDVARELEGEMIVPEPIDFNSLFQDSDGRVYRPLYINSRLQSASYEVQLREVLPLQQINSERTISTGAMAEAVGLDSSAIYVPGNRLALYHYDNVSGKVKKLRESVYSMYVSQGYNCASVTEIVRSGTGYNLYAYNDRGELLSTATDIFTNSLTVLPTNPLESNTAARSARYNPICEVWVLVGNVGSKVYTWVLDKQGALLAEVEMTEATGVMNGFEDIVMTANGYFVNVYNASTSQYAAVLRCDFAEHDLGTYAVWRTGNYRVLGASEKIVVLASGSSATYIYRVADVHYTPALMSIVVAYAMSDWTFECMNSALLVFRRASGNGGRVFDARSGQPVQLSATEMPSMSRAWLSGVDVWSEARGVAKRKRIRLGEDDSRFANYITADGYRYITADGLVYTVKK